MTATKIGSLFSGTGALDLMMGLRPGHITAVPGLSWKDQVKAAGNGVCPQQAALAFRHLLKVSAL